MDWYHIQTIKQVITERAVSHHLLEILIRSSNNPHIRAHGFTAPHTLKFTLLEHAQQFGLQIEAQTSHLVEKQGPHMRQLEFAAAHLDSPGKRPTLMAKKFALDQVLGNGGTVHRHKRIE